MDLSGHEPTGEAHAGWSSEARGWMRRDLAPRSRPHRGARFLAVLLRAMSCPDAGRDRFSHPGVPGALRQARAIRYVWGSGVLGVRCAVAPKPATYHARAAPCATERFSRGRNRGGSHRHTVSSTALRRVGAFEMKYSHGGDPTMTLAAVAFNDACRVHRFFARLRGGRV